MDGPPNKRHQWPLFTFKMEENENGTYLTVHRDHRYLAAAKDDVGALYYVVAVILIYGCSILMMIASYIRKNKVDRRLNRYLKEMANVRKRERRIALMATKDKPRGGTTKNLPLSEAGTSRSGSIHPSPALTPLSGRASLCSFILPGGSLEGRRDQSRQTSFSSQTKNRLHSSSFLGVDCFPRLHSKPLAQRTLTGSGVNKSHSTALLKGYASTGNVSTVLGPPQSLCQQVISTGAGSVARASSPLLIVCDHSDYDSDSEPNNSDKSTDNKSVTTGGATDSNGTGKTSTKLCVPTEPLLRRLSLETHRLDSTSSCSEKNAAAAAAQAATSNWVNSTSMMCISKQQSSSRPSLQLDLKHSYNQLNLAIHK